ncbi:MAG: geranylgeranylglyceryl/heptaprenylglyceryl phosphate synthase [Bacteroidales bacterium]|jgi:putative glycerol-1-phosphate prenyltransferase|nr:geranylgeranylglyceryl/heptaprenylglyceryl phosphate synthase [Bacteroidales bacterium]
MKRSDFPARRSLGLLIDPDRITGNDLPVLMKIASEARPDYILAGGSLTFNDTNLLIGEIKKLSSIPVVLFPGNLLQMSKKADLILLLSLISGRNPELLIGNHVIAAPYLAEVREKLVPTGYILVGCGSRTSVEYMSQTVAIPPDKEELVIATALAGEMLGLGMIYLEGGSGAKSCIPPALISSVRRNISVPLAVGGGLRNGKDIENAYSAGADLVIIGNGCEEDPDFLREACRVRDRLS